MGIRIGGGKMDGGLIEISYRTVYHSSIIAEAGAQGCGVGPDLGGEGRILAGALHQQ